MRILKLGAAFFISFGISACSSPTIDLNQDELCVVSSIRVDESLKLCETGQKIIFQPDSWGNEQLPVMFAAGQCDHRFSIVLTKGAVSCIFKPVEGVDEQQGN